MELRPNSMTTDAICMAMDKIGVGLVLCRPDGSIVRCNMAFANMLGRTQAELQSLTLQTLTHESDCDSDAELSRELLANERSFFEIDKRFIHANGRPVWTHIKVTSINAPEPFLVFMADHLDPQREMAVSLRNSEERFRLMVEASSQLFFYEHDWEGRCLYISPSVETILGYTPLELLDRPVAEFIGRQLEAADDDTQVERAVLHGTKQEPSIVAAQHKRGHTVYLEITSNRVEGEHRRVYKLGVARDVTARKHIEESLLLSHQILQTIDSLVIVVDNSGLVLFASPSVAHMLKCRRTELMGYGWWLLTESSPEQQAMACEYAAQLAKGEKRARARAWEQGVTDTAGNQHWVLWQERQISKDKAIFCGTDITSRRMTEHALRTRTSQLDALIENCPIGILVEDSEGRVQMCNRVFEDIFGYSQYELIGKNSSAFLVPPELQQELQDFERTLAAGQIAKLSTSRRRKDRSRINVEIQAVPLIPMRIEGHASGIFMLFSDITDRVTAERALQESEQQLRAIFNSSLDGIFLMDERGSCVDTNPAGCRLLGRDREEIIGSSTGLLLDGADSERIWGDLMARGWAQQEITITQPAGIVRRLDLSVTRGILPGLSLVIAHDMTEKRELEQKFLQSQKMEAIGRLAGGVAHDINNMLTVIRGYSELIVKKLPPVHPLSRYAHSIVSAADRSSMITQQLLAFSRRQIVMPQRVSANRVIGDILKLIQRLIGEDIELTVDLSIDAGMVYIDPGQLGQVLMNLAVNSRDAMPNGGRLHIGTASANLEGNLGATLPQNAGEYVVVAVSDTGAGMAPEVMAHIFEPFFTTKEVGKGTGLGLATVYGVVQQAGGGVAVESEPGTGTTFRVFLPRVDQENTEDSLQFPIRDGNGKAVHTATP